jgi:hypothetical protein
MRRARVVKSDRSSFREAFALSEADVAVNSGHALLDLSDIGRVHRIIAEGEACCPGP